MVVVALAVLAVLALVAVVAVLARAGRREAQAERVRLAEQERVHAQDSIHGVWAMGDGEFEEYIAGLCRRDGCTQVQRVGGAGDLGADVIGRLPDGRKLVVQCKRYAKHRSVGSRELQTFNGTARQEHGADVPVFVASCVFTQPARTFAAKHALVLVDVNLLGFWNSGTPLTSLIDLDIARSGNHRKLAPDS
ncbi:restriction system protein [Actinacidiphila yanglinensis]|uniref:Restriction system protein n=1 Tax=Actinacidiphila yanglinensis TaxID=310779 RepID=A0A1H6DJG1_9ACTN|nr:restriction endonuclease [Actinacidiphila yanglinensis]SEG85319.1 restriction system protein [Actinacidiphila yanglinensis]